MATEFSGATGKNNEVISVDPEIVSSLVNSIDFTVSKKREDFSDVKRISNCIKEAFDTFEAIKERWEGIANISYQYVRQVDDVPNPSEPQNLELFDDNVDM